jgi:hypothetical protein
VGTDGGSRVGSGVGGKISIGLIHVDVLDLTQLTKPLESGEVLSILWYESFTHVAMAHIFVPAPDVIIEIQEHQK